MGIVAIFILPAISWAHNPLITDDSFTQGRGKYQLEFTGEYDTDEETVDGISVKTTTVQAATTLTYGIIDSLDFAVGIPYLWITEKDNGALVSDVKGISDAIVELKWRFYVKEGLSFALKPGLTLPTGNENKGLGTGKTGNHVFVIVTEEIGAWTFHGNLGYIRNENRLEDNKNLLHASIAAMYAIRKNILLVADTGVEKNIDKSSHTEPAYLLGGVIYSISDDFDIDFGVKHTLSSAETDVSIMAGTTLRF